MKRRLGLLCAAMMLALECAPPRARLHLFGFNWSRRAWAAHKMGAEEAFATALADAGRIRIHWPACAGQRGCGGCPLVAHYDADGGAVCVPRPPGPPGEGERLRAAKFAKDNEWRAVVDRLRPARHANGTLVVLPQTVAYPNATDRKPSPRNIPPADLERGLAGVAAAVRRHMESGPGDAHGPYEWASSRAAPRAGGGDGGDAVEEALKLGDAERAADAAFARRRTHRAIRSPRAL